MNSNTKPGGFWSKVGGFFKGLFNKVRAPVLGLIGKIPVVGNFANQMIDKFVPKGANGGGVRPPNPGSGNQ